jgi:cyclopropane fatty-acyl-phospholipid synthase-like methyltransferase
VTNDDREKIRKMINGYAGELERVYKIGTHLMVKRTKKIVDYLGKLGCQRLLDVGCGTGRVAVMVRKELGMEVDGVDFSEKVVERARDFIKQEGANIRIYCEDIVAPSPDSGLTFRAYDAVLCKDVVAVYTRTGKEQLITAMLKYLKSKGHLIMSVMSALKETPFYSESEETYHEIIKEATGKEPYIERLDEEALLIHVQLD